MRIAFVNSKSNLVQGITSVDENQDLTELEKISGSKVVVIKETDTVEILYKYEKGVFSQSEEYLKAQAALKAKESKADKPE